MSFYFISTNFVPRYKWTFRTLRIEQLDNFDISCTFLQEEMTIKMYTLITCPPPLLATRNIRSTKISITRIQWIRRIAKQLKRYNCSRCAIDHCTFCWKSVRWKTGKHQTSTSPNFYRILHAIAFASMTIQCYPALMMKCHHISHFSFQWKLEQFGIQIATCWKHYICHITVSVVEVHKC